MDGFFDAWIELQALARRGAVHLGKKPRELFQFLLRQGACEIRRVLRDDFAEDPHGIELGLALAACHALFRADPEKQILDHLRVERHALVGQQIADDTIHVVVPLVGVDVYQRSIDVKNNALDTHPVPPEACLRLA